MSALCLRHLLLNFRDRSTFFLSFASSFVILGLYFLFIRDFMLQAVTDFGVKSNWNELFIDSLMLSGFVIVVGSTAGLGILSIYIRDRETRILQDFLVSPISRFRILSSYLASGILISFFMMVAVLGISLVYLYQTYQISYSIQVLLQSIEILFLSGILSNFVLFAAASFLKTSCGFSSFGNLYGVVIGFFTGVYIPAGYYPQIIQKITGFFPMSQTASLLRQKLTAFPLMEMKKEFPQAAEMLKEIFGIQIYVFSKPSHPSLQYFFLGYCLLIFLLYFILVRKSYLFS